ncbi:hypothetical protein [Thermocatellispora tengchongensis]|uniref:hypothetical protein n=1 Tax=Thermocatellispora tengchongensis TaxID=1073253 RepID=UPI00362B2246
MRDRPLGGQVAEGDAEPRGVDAVALTGDGERQAQEQRRTPLVALRGPGQRLQGLLTGGDRHEGFDGRRQPVALDVVDPGEGERRGAAGCEVREERFGAALQFRRGARARGQIHAQCGELPDTFGSARTWETPAGVSRRTFQ